MILRLAATLLLSCGLAFGEPVSFTAPQRAQDFDAMARAVEKDYVYLASRDGWRRSREAWRKKALAATTPLAFALALEGALRELRDDHVFLRVQGFTLERRVPAGTDVWASWTGSRATIDAVRPSSVADVAGLHPGQQIVSVQGVPVERVVRELVGGSANPAARDWALRHVMAGPRDGSYFVGVREEGSDARPRQYEVVRTAVPEGNGTPLLARKIGEARDIAYIRLRNNLGDEGVVMHFDAALQQMRETRAMILDLRSTESGGSEAVVRAILGRFVEKESPWQVREGRGKARTTDVVAPRGPFAFRGPLVVLVDRWTAAEGEALAAGLDAVANATLVGTSMAGLRGVRREVTLPQTGWVVAFPAERALHVNGKSRESLRPDVEVDLVHPSGGPGDPILYQGLKHLTK
ncbi:hypothetical protein BWI17_02815 [Betaproteobacteria bacterium GR16-43]|nr:hypothetical protein BWI17_02815 [Betaproteobacteria bacterium GR16-43]